MKKMAHIRLYGVVQGVGLRYQVYRKAAELGVNGYAKNLVDGSVEIEAEGEEEDILKLIDFVKNGIRYARVEDMDIAWHEYKGEYMGFNIH
ncbi:MAG: acylphosphatase [Thermoanaerobacteraceae bacterium]|nr:acylphosphatase [Thermoanaerobacteraceae bacterium]